MKKLFTMNKSTQFRNVYTYIAKIPRTDNTEYIGDVKKKLKLSSVKTSQNFQNNGWKKIITKLMIG